MAVGDKLAHKVFNLDAMLFEFLCLLFFLFCFFFRLLLMITNLPIQISIKLSTLFWVLGIEN